MNYSYSIDELWGKKNCIRFLAVLGHSESILNFCKNDGGGGGGGAGVQNSCIPNLPDWFQGGGKITCTELT